MSNSDLDLNISSTGDLTISGGTGGTSTITLTGDAAITYEGNPLFTAAPQGGLGLNPPVVTLPHRETQTESFGISGQLVPRPGVGNYTQARFLNRVIENRTVVDIFLNNGVNLRGCTIIEHDGDTVLVESERKDAKGSTRQTQLLVKMNVSSFVLNGTL